MNKRRLVYRVILKILALFAALVLLWVLLNSLFSHDIKSQNKKTAVPQVSIDISDMKKGEIRKARWKGVEVAVLYRKQSSSNNEKFFVYLNHGDSGNCPLFYQKNTLKDICTGSLFDVMGKPLQLSIGYQLEVPSYYFEEKKIFLGSDRK